MPTVPALRRAHTPRADTPRADGAGPRPPGLLPADVLGDSLGGRLALELARRGRARSVVAIGPSGTSFPPERVVQCTGFAVAGLVTRVLRPVMPALAESTLARSVLLANLRLRPWKTTPRETMALLDGFGSPGLWRLILWSALVDVPGRMEVDCPVTLVQGTHDWIATGQTPRFLALVPAARFRVLPFAGHAPMADVPDLLVRLARQTADRA